VETEEQYRVLRDFKCDEYQGFYFAKALPPDEFEAQFSMQTSDALWLLYHHRLLLSSSSLFLPNRLLDADMHRTRIYWPAFDVGLPAALTISATSHIDLRFSLR
jgi:hypothetical protein